MPVGPHRMVFRPSYQLLPCSHGRAYRRGHSQGGNKLAHLVRHNQDRGLHFRITRAGTNTGTGAGVDRIPASYGRMAPTQVDQFFRKGQLVSAALVSLGHGGNDAQKTMGIIAGLLFSTGMMEGTFHVPVWVVLSCQAAIALGDHVRRLAHRQDNGPARDETPARRRLLRRIRGRHHTVIILYGSAYPSAPPTPSRAQSWAWAPCAGLRRSAGALPGR